MNKKSAAYYVWIVCSGLDNSSIVHREKERMRERDEKEREKERKEREKERKKEREKRERKSKRKEAREKKERKRESEILATCNLFSFVDWGI